MTRYVAVYQFLCPNCKHIMVGKPEVDAENAGAASASLRDTVLPCRVCHQSVSVTATAKTFVYALGKSTSDDAIGPAVPRT